MKPAEFLASVRAKQRARHAEQMAAPADTSITPENGSPLEVGAQEAVQTSAVTRQDLEDAIGAIAIALREAVEGGKDAYFTIPRFQARLAKINAAPGIAPFLKLLLDAIQGHSSRGNAVESRHVAQPWSTV
jgi:hypothetical protein